MKHGKLTLDIDRLEVVSHPMQGTEGRDDACPTASATLTPTGQQ
ncbi:MAG TPA: hypothetical protein VFR37_13825 [Longimicrobium sp.]|nr:hypothetical protein [Longimicrobium sp.]